MKIVTRFAPSPTGSLHTGGVRTALFNYLYAKHMGGDFLLRIEDTDRDRSTDEAVKVIFDGLKWLGINYDGDPIFQSSKIARHIEVAFDLVDKGYAYLCYENPLIVSDWKKANKGKVYRSPWRDPSYTDGTTKEDRDGEKFVVRFKTPTGSTSFYDLVKGKITFDNENLDDLVLLRSDGSPTYNLAVVVDDHDSGVNVVCRGDDHVNNTPRQILIYKAMGWDVPKFAHIPLILGEDGKKLSKRDGASSVMDFANAGYLPETMRNYLAKLGWGHGDSEIFSDAEAIEWFDVKDVLSSPARWDTKKLDSFNHHYIGLADNNRLALLINAYLHRKGIWLNKANCDRLTDVVGFLKDGAKTIAGIADLCMPILERVEGDEKAAKVLSDPNAVVRLKWLYSLLLGAGWTVSNLNNLIHAGANHAGIKMKEIGPILRAALTGLTTAPDLGTCLAAIGHEESMRRIRAACGEF
jgi:glutamyl-tRNA synthetase